MERQTYDEILRLREFENLDPTLNDEQRKAFLDEFSWKYSQLTAEEPTIIERLLVKYHRIFARHRLDTRINNEYKIELNPKHDESVYVKSLPAPKNFKDEILVELALQQKHGIITTFPFSAYSSPIFAQRKANG